MNIVLTGMMGTGKSSVGKKLAQILLMDYLDTDEMIEKDSGCSIVNIFEKYGEDKFRDIEKKAVKCAAMLNNYVISTGGGVVKNKENMDELEKNSVVICLTARPEIIYNRVKKDANRPLLKVENPIGEITFLLKQREEYYKRCDFCVDTSDKKIDDIVDEIVKYIESVKK